MTGQEIVQKCSALSNGETLLLEKDARYDVYLEDCIRLTGYHISNTASKKENPLGERFVCFYAKNKRDITIDGNGATVFLHGIFTPFLFDGCENLTIKNLKLDRPCPTMSEFTIGKKLSDGVYFIKVQEDSLFELRAGRLFWVSEKNKAGGYYWESDYRDPMRLAMHRNPITEWTQMMGYNDAYDSDCRFPCVPEFKTIEQIDERTLKVELLHHDAYFPVGERVQTRNTVRDQIGGFFERTKNILMEDVEINAMHGLGLLCQFCENVHFNRVKIVPKESRTIASNADFFQGSGCKGLFHIENCICREGHDDFINIHGTHLRTIGIDKNKITVRFMNEFSRGFEAFVKGDEIEYIDTNTLVGKGQAKVLSVEHINDTDFILEVDDVSGAKIGDAVENSSWTPEILVENNSFGPSTARGILCTSRKKIVIRNNVFYKTGGNALLIEDDCNFWFESGYTTDVLFENNKIIGCGYGSLGKGHVPVIAVNPQVLDKDFTGYVHKKIVVRNNEFSSLPDDSYKILVKWTEDFVFENNKTDREMEFLTTNANVTKN